MVVAECSPAESVLSGDPGRRNTAVAFGGTVTFTAIFSPSLLQFTEIRPHRLMTLADTWLSCGMNSGATMNFWNAQTSGSGVAAEPPSGRRIPARR